MIYLSIVTLLACSFDISTTARVDYSGHKLLRIEPKSPEQLQFLKSMKKVYMADFWNLPQQVGEPALVRLRPNHFTAAEDGLNLKGIEYQLVFNDLKKAIQDERRMNSPQNESLTEDAAFDFSIYNKYEKVLQLIESLAEKYPKIAQLEAVGKTYENRPIYSLKIGKGDDKPAIQMDFGIHSREWAAIGSGAYFVNKLITTYGQDPEVTKIVDQYEFNVIVMANPDGYVYTWETDRLWRKTRSKSSKDILGFCRGTDPNRNFDVEHCGVGTSNDPCDQMFCGDKPFSEGESRAIRDLLISLGKRCKAFISVHTYSQLWMTPHGNTKDLPPNYGELERIGKAGMKALAERYGTEYRLGSIANIIYEAAGSTVDYAYKKHNVSISFALELRDKGRFGFVLPQKQLLPTCEETFDGLMGAIKAM